ncbi:MAG: CoB--CoM heterodisulfide reductase iron-sulfur subunit B family protein [Candidatus Thorarchaeota archaeon]|nr:MAG: CoB--CoM heterodisulfide reductase iron-sulfur subunit B family protein [Candidatus Thorarchaeota archaeon]
MVQSYEVFLGCAIPNRFNNYESSMRAVAKELDIKLIDFDGASCCGTVVLKSIDENSWLALSGRNIALAENRGHDILTPCNGCFGSLKDTDHVLHDDETYRKKINAALKGLGLEYTGKAKIRHLVEVLYELKDEIEAKILKPLNGLRIAFHPGCHLIRPSNVAGFDDPELPRKVDELLELTGAKCVPWGLKLSCCGSPLLITSEDIATNVLRDKMISARDASANCLVTNCPACHTQFDVQLIGMKDENGESLELPALFVTQILGLAMGIDQEPLGLELNRISLDPIADILGI